MAFPDIVVRIIVYDKTYVVLVGNYYNFDIVCVTGHEDQHHCMVNNVFQGDNRVSKYPAISIPHFNRQQKKTPSYSHTKFSSFLLIFSLQKNIY